MIKKLSTIVLFIGLIVSNVMSVASSAFNAFLHDALARLPIEELLVNSPTAKQRKADADAKARKAKVAKARMTSKRIARRTVRNVGKNLASLPLEAVPYVGIVTLTAVTAMDVKDGCDTMKDVNEMMTLLDADADIDESDVCGLSVPSASDLAESAKRKFSSFWDGEASVSDIELEEYKKSTIQVVVEDQGVSQE